MSWKISSTVAAAAVFGLLSANLASAADVVASLAAKAAEKGTVRVIVSFAEPSTAADLGSTTDATVDARHTVALRAVQSAIVGSTLGTQVATADRHALTLMDVAPMFAATVDAAELKRLAADPRVADIQEDHLDAPTLIQSTAIIHMGGTTGAWAKGATGRGRIVAVLDTGVNKNHEFLKFGPVASKVVSEACYNTNDATYGSISRCPGRVTASTAPNSGLDCAATITGCGHGTHVAGIAAGRNTSQSPREPSRGVAFDAAVMAVDVFSRFDHKASAQVCGSSATQDCVLSWTSDQIKGLERVYALRRGIGLRKIASVNMSLGGGYYSGYCDTDSRKPIIDKLRVAGIAVVIAAGNNYYTTGVGAPGCISTAVTVGATTKRTAANPERVASYSNVGPQVDVFAPGGDFGYPAALGDASLILSSHFSGYDYLAGTSMAAPHVAGAFAAIRSKASCAAKTVGQIELGMKTTGPLITDTRGTTKIKRRRVDVALTIAKVCP